MSEFMTSERFEVLKATLENRTEYITLCTENMFHPQNASALVRSCEAFGIQRIHTVEVLCDFKPNVNIVRGSDKWIDISRHTSSADAIASLKSEGYRVVATMPHKDCSSPESFDVSKGKFALFFGTEHAGVSEEVVAAADDFIAIPMCGFVESLNVSASAAILLYNLTQKIRHSDIEWHLDREHKEQKLLEWVMKSIKDSKRILQRAIDGGKVPSL